MKMYRCERCGYESEDIEEFNTPTGLTLVCDECYKQLISLR